MRKPFFGYRVLKTAVGAALAIFFAQALGLQYAVSAGVITVLSVQNTKKKSLELAIQRLSSTTLALFTAAAVFTLFGYSPWTYGLYLLFFIPAAARLRLHDGIVPSSVLVTHLLLEKSVALPLLLNEYGILFIGAGIALIFNLHMPSVEKEIRQDQQRVENLMKAILRELASSMMTQSVAVNEEKLFVELDQALKGGYERAQRLYSNSLTRSYTYYIKYMEMRIRQAEVLKQMRSHFSRISKYYEQNRLVASLTELVAYQFHELNTAQELLEDLEGYLEIFRGQELPKTREEFENRSSLYQYVRDLQILLALKREFAASLSEEEKVRFWIKK